MSEPNYNSDEINREWESSRAASILTFIDAILIVVSPFAFQFHHLPLALWNTVGVGALVVVLVCLRLGGFGRILWPAWLILASSLWLIAAPFVLQYRRHEAAFLSDVILGAFLLVMAIWSICDNPQAEHPRA